jgi:predicted regulator of Ras-like GTPase activity (Roadblock/LC7/MglB family)
MSRADGAMVLGNTDGERGQLVAQHLTQVSRMASATLARAGLGALRRGMIETESDVTFLAHDATGSLCVTLEGHAEVGSGLAQVGRLWTKLGARG